MEITMKRTSFITRVLFVAVLIAGLSANSFAQKKEKPLKRPSLVHHASVDKFVDSSFDVYERNQKLTEKLSDAAGNVTEAKAIKNKLEAQMKEVTGLLGQSADVMKKAKTITPKTDSMKAVKALNVATKALNKTKENIPGQIEQIKAQAGSEE